MFVTIFLWLDLILTFLGVILTIGYIGEDRNPITPGTAITVTILNIPIALALLAVLGIIAI